VSAPSAPGGDYIPLAHGIGGQQDLPIPLETAIVAAVAALVISFVVLAWTVRNRTDEAPPDVTRTVPAHGGGRMTSAIGRLVDSPGWVIALRTLGMVLLAYTAMVAIFGADLEINPLFGIFYVWWWVGLVFASMLLGPVWRAISPVRTINSALNRLRRDPSGAGLYAYDEARFGYWPAVIGLLAFTWMELIYTHNSYLGPVRLWIALYFAAMLLGGQLWGERFYANADPFEVYSTLMAKLSVWARDDSGRLVVRSPLANLDSLAPHRGLVAVVSVLFGTIVFDSFRDATAWLTFIQGENVVARHAYLADNIALVLFPAAVAGFFCAGTMLTGVGDGDERLDRRRLPGVLAPSMIPIIGGYVVAHYLSYFLEGGQATLIQASDPFSDGANWFGTANWSVSYYFAYHPTMLANVKVIAVVIGHILGVVCSHRRAIAVLPRRHQVTGQIPLLVTMVGFTVGGLYLLFSA